MEVARSYLQFAVRGYNLDAMTDQRTAEVSIHRVGSGTASDAEKDLLAVEEPLEIQVGLDEGGRTEWKTVSITMRTPGNDAELATGFLFAEGIVSEGEDIKGVEHCGPPTGPRGVQNVIRLLLAPGLAPALERLNRNFYTASSCGVCGKTSIEAVQIARRPDLDPDRPRLERSFVEALPSRLFDAQEVFHRTGGLHAAALFLEGGEQIAHGEDVGRHNAVDKVIGSALAAGHVPAHGSVLAVSGRAGFELVQKALMASIPVMAAIGAPSSLAVDLAKEFGMTLLGFVRKDQFNVYCGHERLVR